MTENSTPRNPQIEEDEKITTVMIYTHNMLAWGQVVSKKALRISTWLRTDAIPKYFYLHNAKIITYTGGIPRPQAFQELYLPSAQIVGFHIQPPASEPIDYDPNEPMRIMLPTTALIGPFRFDGLLRMSSHSNLERFLDVLKETFTSIYDVEITQPSTPRMGAIKVPFALIRNETVLFSPREAP